MSGVISGSQKHLAGKNCKQISSWRSRVRNGTFLLKLDHGTESRLDSSRELFLDLARLDFCLHRSYRFTYFTNNIFLNLGTRLQLSCKKIYEEVQGKESQVKKYNLCWNIFNWRS